MSDNEPTLAEAVKLLKQVEHHYRIFDRAAQAAQVVHAAHNDVASFQKNIDKAKADLDGLKNQIAQNDATRKGQEQDLNSTRKQLDELHKERSDLEKHMATFRPQYEREKERLERDTAGLKDRIKAELEQERRDATAAIAAEVDKLRAGRDELQAECNQLLKRRADLKEQVERALAGLSQG